MLLYTEFSTTVFHGIPVSDLFILILNSKLFLFLLSDFAYFTVEVCACVSIGGRPDMTFAVDWALNSNDLSRCVSVCLSVASHFSENIQEITITFDTVTASVSRMHLV